MQRVVEGKWRWVAKLSARQDELRVGDVNTERAESIISAAKPFSHGHKAYIFCRLVININDVNREKRQFFFSRLEKRSLSPFYNRDE